MTALPWGEHGVDVTGQTKAAALNRANLGWRVEKAPIFTQVGSRKIELPGRRVLVRTDNGKPLAVVSDDWSPVQNEDALDVFETVARAVGGQLEYLGQLGGGRITWGLSSTGLTAQVGDRVADSYVLVSNPHIYGRTMDARYVAMLREPAATIVMPLSTTLRQTHRSSVSDSLATIRREVESRHRWLEQSLAQLASTRALNPDEFFASVMRGIKPAMLASRVLAEEVGGDTYADLVHAAARAIDTRMGYATDTRLASSWYGINRARKEQVVKTALRRTAG